jgi:hypothetical protein
VDIPNGMATSFASFYINVGRRVVSIKKGLTGKSCTLQSIMFSDKIPHAHVHLIPIQESTEKIFRNSYIEVLQSTNRPPANYQTLTYLCNKYKIGNI